MAPGIHNQRVVLIPRTVVLAAEPVINGLADDLLVLGLLPYSSGFIILVWKRLVIREVGIINI